MQSYFMLPQFMETVTRFDIDQKELIAMKARAKADNA